MSLSTSHANGRHHRTADATVPPSTSPADATPVDARRRRRRPRLRDLLQSLRRVEAGLRGGLLNKGAQIGEHARRLVLRVALALALAAVVAGLLIGCVVLALVGLAQAFSSIFTLPPWGGMLIVAMLLPTALAVGTWLWLRSARARRAREIARITGSAPTPADATPAALLSAKAEQRQRQAAAGLRDAAQSLSSPAGLLTCASAGFLAVAALRRRGLARTLRLVARVALGSLATFSRLSRAARTGPSRAG